MKIALLGISEIKLGKHNLKDPRLDEADRLGEADKKTNAQVDVIGPDDLLDADSILVASDQKADRKHLMHTSGVVLNLDLEVNLPWVLVDANQMKQVLLNLVHNALQAMPSGGEMKILTETVSRSNRDWVVVSVMDTGIGISQSEQARIFEPFYTTKGNRGGTGFGLSVTYGIVTDHGGQIDVESQPGKGSKFTVWLPL